MSILPSEARIAMHEAQTAHITRERSMAIREFCEAAGILGSVEALNLPDYVKVYRMMQAVEHKMEAD